MDPQIIEDRRALFHSYDQNVVTVNGEQYGVMAVFKDTAAEITHLFAQRCNDSRLYHILQDHEYAAYKIDRSILTLIDYMQNEKHLQWIYTRDRIYHCFHVCFCKRCRDLNGKIYIHSQANWDGHLRHVDADDVFTFPTVVNV